MAQTSTNMTWTERALKNQAKLLLGAPAGISTFRQTGRLGAAGVAAIGEFAEPMLFGAAWGIGLSPYHAAGTNVAGLPSGWTFGGINLQRTSSTWSRMVTEGASGGLRRGWAAKPFTYGGTMYTGTGRAAAGISKGGAFSAVAGSAVGIAFAGYSAYEGYKESVVTGAARGVGRTMWEMAKFNLLMRAVGPWWPVLATQAASGAHVYGQIRKDFAASHRRGLGTAGPLDAFNTKAAYTMRQRSLQSIQRGFYGGRSLLSNEAQALHVSTYRGI